MITKEQINQLNNLLIQLRIDYDEYFSQEEDYEIDYEDLRKEIFNIQGEIKAITECWDE